MKTMKTKTFETVAESRRWKEAVSRQTAGMTPRTSAGTIRHADEPACILREDPPAR